jgi:hypothetical protein
VASEVAVVTAVGVAETGKRDDGPMPRMIDTNIIITTFLEKSVQMAG